MLGPIKSYQRVHHALFQTGKELSVRHLVALCSMACLSAETGIAEACVVMLESSAKEIVEGPIS